ncbi:hypothetical protein EV561_103129 [Rhizobium sp. BK376]|nr:hypothetical protein EV561_103129 [Rhizobium sp. BK376]
MTDAMEVRGMTAAKPGDGKSSIWSRLWIMSILYSLFLMAVLVFLRWSATDYVGADNDDVMRLVEVRDFLAGQGWFDLMQYRLGLDAGTLMHWSRLIDLPIASLIAFFRLFVAPERAEVLALTVWPLSLVLPLMYGMGLTGYRTGGIVGMHISLGLTGLYVMTSNRFLPGSIDHDNVQLGLVAFMTAMLVDDRFRPASFAIAGFAAALAIAIGAETTPFVAVACLAVALLWAWEGKAFAAAAQAFSLTLAVSISVAFFATVPPHLYSTVTCDNLSIGFYGITSVGGVVLLLSSLFASGLSRVGRFVVLAAGGVVIAGTALLLAPQCLGNPLGDLDPMLVKLWLNGISEAQSFVDLARKAPETLGAFYAVGVFACAACLFRIVRGERVRLYLILLTLLLVNLIIAFVQVRGATFSNLLAIPPLTLLLIELRRVSNADSENIGAAFFYIVGALISVPAVWAVGGGLVNGQMKTSFVVEPGSNKENAAGCFSKEALAPIAGLDPGVVSAPSDMGAPILRFTKHRALSGPYHRDQAGMLTQLHIELAEPAEAEAFLRGAKVTLFAYCPDNPETSDIADIKPDGLYAALKRGQVPSYLEPLPNGQGADVKFFRFKP